MSIDTKIYLNPHATLEKIMNVMHYVSHVPQKYSILKSNSFKAIDFNRPPSLSNPFIIKSLQKNNIQPTETSPNLFSYEFDDVCHEKHMFYVHTDITDNDFFLEDGFKLISGNFHLFNLVLGKKLIDFFGGKMIYADCNSFDDPKNLYIKPGVFKNRLHLFSKMKKEKKDLSQLSDYYFYEFYSKLYRFSKITAVDILTTQEQFKIQQLSPSELLFFKTIDSLEKKEKLEKSLLISSKKNNLFKI